MLGFEARGMVKLRVEKGTEVFLEGQELLLQNMFSKKKNLEGYR